MLFIMEGIDLAGVVDSDFQGIQINFAPPRPTGFANFRGAGRGGARPAFLRGGRGRVGRGHRCGHRALPELGEEPVAPQDPAPSPTDSATTVEDAARKASARRPTPGAGAAARGRTGGTA